MTLMEILIVLFFFIPLSFLVLMFIVLATWMQVQEECRQ